MSAEPRNVYSNSPETLNAVPSSPYPSQDWMGQSEEFFDISYTNQSPSAETYSSNDQYPWNFVQEGYRTSPEQFTRVTAQPSFNLESGNGRYASIPSTVREEGWGPSTLSNNTPSERVGGSQTPCSTFHREIYSRQRLFPPSQHRHRRQSHSLHNKLMKKKHTTQRTSSTTSPTSERKPNRPDVIQFIPKGGESPIHCARYSAHKMVHLRVGDLRRNIAIIRKIADCRRIQLTTPKVFLSDDNIYVMSLGTRMIHYWINDIVALDGEFQGRTVSTWLTFPPNSFDQNLVSIGVIKKRVLLFLDGVALPEEPHSVQQNLELFIKGVLLRDDSHRAGHSGLRSQAINKLTFILDPIRQRDMQYDFADVQIRMCIACTDELPPSGFPINITTTCQHEVNSCISCLQLWIESQMDRGGLEAIKCMQCPEPLLYEDIKCNASRSVFQRYDKLITREMLNGIPNFRWCLRPGCEAGQIHIAEKDGPIFTCCDTTCRFKTCVNHNMPWHEGETCVEYDYRTVGKFKDDAASEERIKELCKRCAKCDSPIEKNNGCDHMTCFKCKYEFCWICLVPWDNIRKRDDAGHEPHCKNYRVPRQRPGVPPVISPPNRNAEVYQIPTRYLGYGLRTPEEYARDPYLIREPDGYRAGEHDAELNRIREQRERERSRERYRRRRH